MKFRPCIDLHHGQVKQIVGSTLNSTSDELATNFTSTHPAEYYSRLYRQDELEGGHVIMLGPGNREAAQEALQAWPNHLQVGGGITQENAQEWIAAGASHVIVTSYIFTQGQIDSTKLEGLMNAVGKERLVLDLSCRRRPNDDANGPYYVVTDKWQTFTNTPVNKDTLTELSKYCCEFLVHGVDVEGQQCGILPDLVELLGTYSPISVTYAGGVRSLEDLELVEALGKGRVDCTIGSALDLFGGNLKYKDVVKWHLQRNPKTKTT